VNLFNFLHIVSSSLSIWYFQLLLEMQLLNGQDIQENLGQNLPTITDSVFAKTKCIYRESIMEACMDIDADRTKGK
jgi:hypothetical protein